MKKNIFLIIISILILLLPMPMLAGCVSPAEAQTSQPAEFTSLDDIAGITEDETDAIRLLQQQNEPFIYAMPASIEAYMDENGEIHGFSVLFCRWLSQLTGLNIEISLYDWDELVNDLGNINHPGSAKIAFTGEMTATEQRKELYHMTGPIASRQLKTFRLVNAPGFDRISETRLPRCGFMAGASTINAVSAELEPGTFELIEINSYDEVYTALKNGDIDLFYYSAPAEFHFLNYPDIVADDFYPLSFIPVSLMTGDPRLEPVISVVDKALHSGALIRLAAMYNEAFDDYLRFKLHMQLTDEEHTFIQNNPVIPVGLDPFNYPYSFYNRREDLWQGASIEILDEFSRLTGLTFVNVNDEHAEWTDIRQMLISGDTALVPRLNRIPENTDMFLWLRTAEQTDRYALISRTDHPDININEVLHTRVGLVHDTSYAAMFRKWFPNHEGTAIYRTMEAAFEALRNGEVDMVMANQSRLLYLVNYMEYPDYKVNLLFDYTIDTQFGINNDWVLLHSILEKTMNIVDTDSIIDRWMSKTYDYRTKLAEERLPLLVFLSVLLLCILVLVAVLWQRSRKAEEVANKLVEERTKELQLASKSKSDFLANMSHEIRTPMNAIIGMTELLLEGDYTTDELRDTHKKINTAGNVLLGLVSNILDISKIEAGKFTLNPVRYDLADLLHNVIAMNVIRIGDKPLEFRFETQGELPCELYGDDLRIKQILNNLISNAIKYTREGTITVSVSCTRTGDDINLIVSVSDTGIGIRSEDLDKIFSTFNQVDTQANRHIEGAGLGLDIAKKLAELMDGSISAESEYGKGSRFTLCVRQGFVAADVMDAQTIEGLHSLRFDSKTSDTARLERPDLSYANVLVVDDSDTNLDVAMKMLGKYNIHVDCATNGRDAISIIEKETPVYDAVFMDHMMPEMDGIETVKHIRALGTQYAQTIPIIALTANVLAGNEQMFKDNGFNAFLPKPLGVRQMDAAVREWIMRKDEDISNGNGNGNSNGNSKAGMPPAGDTHTPQASETIDIPGINTKLALHIYDGDVEMFKDILHSFVSSTPKELAKIQTVSESDLPQYAGVAHTIKGNAGFIGATAIAQQALELEKMAKAGDITGVLSAHEQFIKQTEALVDDISAWFSC